MRISQEDKVFAVVACLTAHVCLGIIPFAIMLYKRSTSPFVAFYGVVGLLAGSFWIVGLLLACAFAGSLFGTVAGGAVGTASAVLGCPCLILMLLAGPAMLVVMIISAISAAYGKYVELPVITNLAHSIAGN